MIPIDTRNYEKQHGQQPMGRRYWSFRIVTNSTAVTFRTATPVTYSAACDEVRKRADALGAASIIVTE
ncbi:hypothetical protein J4G48_0040405 [Bradyrhizobium barranii subsp. apii]|jgi:hypothetical protein|uniref:hypothetical protein n=1 Tax=Bradyrhizobium barranii TaxID=2992140 RepID=UPI001AA0E787|nr:hypothetical protein [Bradyrhizobium barranii]UPT95420.1 hypothetical protein J4G48_0040405 [Bradyrhizobium barranii subsp. apii]